MPTLYNYYDSNNDYYFKLINKPVNDTNRTYISLGDDSTQIYTKASGTINFTANINLEQSLTVGSSASPYQLTVYNKLGVNSPSSVYTNITTHIRNNINNSVATPPSFNNTDLLLLENATGSYLQFLSDNTTTSGIGFSTTSARNRGSIEYDHLNNKMTFRANNNNNNSSMTFDGSTLIVPNISASTNLTVSSTLNSVIIDNNNVLRINVITPPTSNTISADYKDTSIVVAKFSSTSPATITLNIPHITSSEQMRVIYLLVRSNGNYSINTTNTNPLGGSIRFPSDFSISPSANNRYDMYSFLTNGQDTFCTFAYNYNFTPSAQGGVLA